MKKLEISSPEVHSADLVAGNIEQLKALFPELITEGPGGVCVNVDVLKALVGDKSVTDADEKYGLNWHGKRRARQLALTPSTGTLRPCPEESVDLETTQNLMIEGDNLEVLKLLQKSYAGKVKLIYIDPPYNTGKDFVYPDNFQDNIRNYQQLMGWRNEAGVKISSLAKNSEASGRFHTDWLNMIYPRLKLAHSLLSESGVILVSLDDGEIDNLRHAMRDIFGEENFVAQILWKKRSTPPNDKIIGANHDYIALFCRNIGVVALNLKERSQDQVDRYKNPDSHPKGVWAPGDLMANVKGGRYVESLNYPIVNPKTGQSHMPSESERANWRFSKEKLGELMARDEIYFGEDGRGRPKLKRFLCDVKDGVTYPTLWDFVPLNTNGSSEMQMLFGNSTVFESPKPVGLIQELIKLATNPGDIVLDFFAGSGSTGHAVLAQNATDNGNRKYILVQLPEPLDPSNSEQKTASDYCDQLGRPRTIAELTKERLRRAGKKILDSRLRGSDDLFASQPASQKSLDVGFRVFKLDSSNIRAWQPDAMNIEQTLIDHMEHIVPGRTESDILYELLLKLGLDLCVPIEQRVITTEYTDGTENKNPKNPSVNSVPSVVKTIHAIGGGVLMACLAERIARDEVEPLAQGIIAWHKELAPAGDATCIFRDSAFADDVAKTNLAAILEQHGIQNVRSL